MNALLFAAFMAATEAPPAPDGQITLPIMCSAEVCIVPREIVKEMMDAHNYHVEKIRKLEEEVKHPVCAKVIETEPSKNKPAKEKDAP